MVVSAAEGGEGRRWREGEGKRREKKVGGRHCSGQCPERPFPPIAVAVNADQSVVVQ